MTQHTPTPAPRPAMTSTRHRSITIGLPKSEALFPLTPEGAGMLTEHGYRILVEKGASEGIHYTDNHYIAAGASIVERPQALGCDIVINLGPLGVKDIAAMRRGTMLFTLWHPDRADAPSIRALLDRSVITVALDLVGDSHGHTPFADILAEIDGRAAIAVASSLLADAVTGKGILLGGVAGINPCEVTIFGSGIAARAAARSAFGLGAMVRMFDDDVYCLRAALQELGPAVVGSALQPRALSAALRTADVVVATPMRRQRTFDSEDVSLMKRGVIVFDLIPTTDRVFPSLKGIDLATGLAQGPVAMGQVCYIHARSAVPRTTAMALSDTLITMLSDIHAPEQGSVTDALKLSPGLQKGVLTFLGHPVHRYVAKAVGMRQVDISLFIHLT